MAKSIVLTHHGGCRIIPVDAKPDSYGFYEKHGFKRTIRKQNETISIYRIFHRE
jgi:septin family protein